ASLGMLGASFPGLMNELKSNSPNVLSASRLIYGISVALFLFSIVTTSLFLVYPGEYVKVKRRLQSVLVAMGIIVLTITMLLPVLSLIMYLLLIFALLFCIIVMITAGWLRVEVKRLEKSE
ncbi:MAG TPA: hypothetical protein VFE54_01340, partial [Mucilaginibacter sp.]|nr:hypothetical protein [Mucilaginibacter sp.]